MWIADGEKYALVGLEVKLEGTPPPEQIAPNLWVLTATTFDVPSEWREWLGSIRADEVAGSNLFLVSKLASATPDVLDGENQSLQQRVWHFYVGLLLSVMFSPSHKPVMLTGARRDGVIGVRQQRDLELPAPQVLPRYPPIVVDDILLAAQLGQKLDAMSPVTVPGGLWRLFRTLNIYVETRAIGQLVDRVHRYCRCIDGLILPAIGKTKQTVQKPDRIVHRAGPSRPDECALRHPKPCRTPPREPISGDIRPRCSAGSAEEGGDCRAYRAHGTGADHQPRCTLAAFRQYGGAGKVLDVIAARSTGNMGRPH